MFLFKKLMASMNKSSTMGLILIILGLGGAGTSAFAQLANVQAIRMRLRRIRQLVRCEEKRQLTEMRLQVLM